MAFPIIQDSLALSCCNGPIPNSQISPLGNSFFRVGYLQIIQKWPPIWIPLDYFGAKRWRDKKNIPKIQTGQCITADQDQRNWRRSLIYSHLGWTMHNNSFLPLSFFFLLLFFFIYGSNMYFCVWGRGGSSPLLSPRWIRPCFILKKI